ncbi:MAG: hypothetical protein K0Q56_856 [Sporolactobacillus laevolacticus]|jgi:hypothetical protein|nr:hypothetical protein [Sporolactobacillus laevolacticus]
MKKCIACGMPMKSPEDYPLGDETKDYCKYCAKPDGTMQNYEEKLTSMTEFVVKTQGLDRQVAEESAAYMLSKLPAWKKERS